MEQQDWPITGVAVVADIGRCPAGYTTVSLGSHRTSTNIKSKYFVHKISVIFLIINLNIYFILSNEIQEKLMKYNVYLKKLYFTAVKIWKVVFHSWEI